VSVSPVCSCLSCPAHPNESTRPSDRPVACGFYPNSSMTDAQWRLIEPLLPAPGNTGGRGGRVPPLPNDRQGRAGEHRSRRVGTPSPWRSSQNTARPVIAMISARVGPATSAPEPAVKGPSVAPGAGR
jgi:hypothetical protein